MKRLVLLGGGLAAMLLAGPSFAGSYEQDIVAQLRAQGYVGISLSHTWLGRARIVASNDRFNREIILDPNTGEILRDLSDPISRIAGNTGQNEATTTSNPARKAVADPGVTSLTVEDSGVRETTPALPDLLEPVTNR